MMDKRFMQAAGVLILAFAMAAAGCKDDSTEEDTWTNVTELSQINGTWKGSFKQDSKPIKEVMEQFGQQLSDEILASLALLGDMEVALDAEIVMTINASEKTQSTDITMTMAFSKGDIDTVWPLIKAQLLLILGAGATPNDADHSVKIEMKSPPAPISAEDEKELLKGLQINQHGTKVKEPAQPANPEKGIPAIPEIIFEKQ